MDSIAVDTDALRALAGDFRQAADELVAASPGIDSSTGLRPADLGAPPVGPALHARYERQRADARDGRDVLQRELRSVADRLTASAGNYERAETA